MLTCCFVAFPYDLQQSNNWQCCWSTPVVGVGTKKDTSLLARAMREEGKTLQQIANELGYKNRSSVYTLLKDE